MSRNNKMIQEYIGEGIEKILNDESFKKYKFVMHVDNDLPDYVYMYVCDEHGF